MTSKQEKLAAARKKLKEFQGKNKEGEVLKQKNISNILTNKILKEYSNDSVIQGNHVTTDGENSTIGPQIPLSYCTKQAVFDQKIGENERKVPQLSSNGNTPSKLWQEHSNVNLDSHVDTSCLSGEKSDCTNGLKADSIESHKIDEKNFFDIKSYSSSLTGDDSVNMTEKSHGNSDFFSLNDASNTSCLNDIVEPLKLELQNHSQTIKILIQQRNDAQTALIEAQTLLDKKSGEANELQQQIIQLTTSLKSLSQRLSDAEDVIMKLKLEKEDNLLKEDEMKAVANEFQTQLNEKQEELQEVKRKHLEKSNECQSLLFSLQEAQSQLSLYQIQLQQYSSEGLSGLITQASELQNENVQLKQKLVELEGKVELEKSEKEESSQKFHIYAQQCNSQLSILNSQLNSLKLENEKLFQRNDVLSANLSELESAKDKAFSSKSFEDEIANLHDQISALHDENSQQSMNLKKKEEECKMLEDKLHEKESDLNQLIREIKELEKENKKLASEAEMPKANERLLATMESDKVAAAKAVSQNQKLKEQVLDLEKAFMKLSEEKLELTNQLAHEKHVNGELQNLTKNWKSKHHVVNDDGDDNHNHQQECPHENEKPLLLVNDSNEIEELRNIVRQLQDDKIELTARLYSFELNRNGFHEEMEKQKKSCEHERNHEEDHCENTKSLLQQMEEKVKKTMNEIAVLDEEKEKLEHLVLQLQGETETIGEYITLYQKQRMLLRQRAQEKDIQLMQLSKDKEELKSKLVALDELVQCLILERENVSVQPGSKLLTMDSSPDALENTAGKIRALISEIGSTTLINNQTFAFEHCSCCSGRLITI